MKKFAHQQAIVAACSGIAAAFVGAVILQSVPTAPLSGDLLMHSAPGEFGSSASEMKLTVEDLEAELLSADEFSLDGYETESSAWDPSEVVSVIETENGEIIELTAGQLVSPYEGDASAFSDDVIEYVGTAVCANTTKKTKVNAKGKTTKYKFTKKVGRTTVSKEIAQRCARSDAEASAKTDGLGAFKNSCELPDSCTSNCIDRGTTYAYNPDPPKVTFNVTEHNADPIMNCAGGKSYSATATVTGDCTSTRECKAKSDYRPIY